MEGIEHRSVEVNGINMHVAEKGQGPVVLFLHGFPELWYSWRHQILALSDRGYRCVAPDLRGFGDTDAPASVDSYNGFHVVGDLVALIQSLQVEQVFLVGHDWGALIGWYLCMFRPQLIKAYVCLSVPFLRRNPTVPTVDSMRALYGDDYYICRFQEAGKAEAEMAQVGAEYVVKNMITTRKTGPPIFPKGEYGTAFNPDMKQDLPSWLTQQDLAYFVSKFKKTGFTGGLNYYRNLNKNWELTAPWSGAKIKVSVKFITGELDMVYTSLGMKDYIESGGFKEDVPGLEEVIIQPGVAHFNNQESPLDITNHIYDFITKNWELEAPYSGVKIKVPVRFITGELDMVYTSLGLKEYIHDGRFKEDVPNLEHIIIQTGVAHFNTMETPEDVTNHIYTFITKFDFHSI